MRLLREGATLAAVLALAACAGASTTANPPVVAGCPAVGGNGYVSADYVDFVHAFGQQYIAGVGPRPVRVNRTDLDRVVLRSRCSFSALNDRTHKDPGDPRDGDTAFLAPGTPIFAVSGWSPRCRLAARSPAGLVAYLAQDPHAKTGTPKDCALHR